MSYMTSMTSYFPYTYTKILTRMIRELYIFIRQVQECEALYLSILELKKGHLSHHLVHTNFLENALNHMSEELRNTTPNIQLLHRDTSYYYDKAKTGAIVNTEHGRLTLLIVVQAPLTSVDITNALTLWKVNRFPLKSPDNQNHYTILSGNIQYVSSCITLIIMHHLTT